MAKQKTHPPIVLPARMRLRPNAFKDLEVAVFDLPYREPIWQFMQALRKSMGKAPMWWHYPPYRLLNDAIAACTPTVVHGFKKYGKGGSRRMLSVGKRDGNPALQYPSEDKIAHLIRVWINHWGRSPALKRHIEGKLEDQWDTLESAIDKEPDTGWRRIDPAVFSEEIFSEDGLAFEAVPSLLATLLHDQTSTVGAERREIKWRRSQDESNSFCVVSQPLPISFLKEGGRFGPSEMKQGFFAYKLVFGVQLQTGRDYPWIYPSLHCQRYASQPLRKNKRGSSITLLAGINQDRLEGWGRDTTLVRLKALPYTSQKWAKWAEQLPELLSDVNARSLVNPYDVYQNPQAFWQLPIAEATQPITDEFYIPHVEGYRYPNNSSQPVATGFGLAERSEIIEQTCCGLLESVLQPDTYLEADELIFSPSSLPLPLQTFSDISKPPDIISKEQAAKQGIDTAKEARQQHKVEANRAQRKERQGIPQEAIRRALAGKELIVFTIYRSEDTKLAIHQQLRNAFLLNSEAGFPAHITVKDCPIYDAELLKPLTVGELEPAERHKSPHNQRPGFDQQWKAQIRKSRSHKRESWRVFIQALKSLKNGRNICQVAFIELPEEPSDTKVFHKDQGIKGVVREACAREKVLSQMILPVKLKADEQEEMKGQNRGRVQNAVHDLVGRQLGVLYGRPDSIYQTMGLPLAIAQNLDIIAFCITETKLDVLYCCAIRLSANGGVDVQLPNPDNLPENDHWIPYHEAGWNMGELFGKSRIKREKKGEDSHPIKLSKAALNSFIETVLSTQLERPTIALIKAKKWRNFDIGWNQLTVRSLSDRLDVLEFKKNKQDRPTRYQRDDQRFDNLLGVIRIRTDEETPQYITNRGTWQDDSLSKDLSQLSGFIDVTEHNVFHYFSIGRLPSTVGKAQSKKSSVDLYKSEDGGGIAFKHQQMVEMLPFFVRPDFQTAERLKALCRVPHYLRFSPAWSMGNIVLPYPMHLGDQLLNDQLCILPNRN